MRTAKEIIDEAISENRFGERLLYGFAIAFVSVGLSVLIWGAMTRAPMISLAGAISSGFFWPAMRSARQTRKESIAIRLLEAPLSRADTAREAAEMLHRLFDELFRSSRQPEQRAHSLPDSGRLN